MASLLDAAGDCLDVKWLDGSQVDDLSLDTVLLLQLLSGDDALSDRSGLRDKCDVLPYPLNLGLTDL